MPCLDALAIRNLRNLDLLRIEEAGDFNLITGDNGTGKTTVLEAIFLVGHGRSFRTYKPSQFIRRGESEASVRAVVEERAVVLKRNPKKLVIQVDDNPAARRDLVRILPVRKFVPQDHRLIEGGSVLRRQYLDWGPFHLEPGFQDCWMRFVRSLRQRNAELKRSARGLEYWDRAFCQASEDLEKSRRSYWQGIAKRADERVADCTGLDNCSIEFYCGWRKDKSLAEELKRNRKIDQLRGYTSAGPHRADLVFRVSGKPASQQLSRGQQKLWNIALSLAQIEHHFEQTGERCVWLIDDLASELDKESFGRILSMFRAKHCQFWLTAFAEQAGRFEELLGGRGAIARKNLGHRGKA